MKTTRLDLLRKKLIGRSKISDYNKLFSIFPNRELIELEQSILILDMLYVKFTNKEDEILKETNSFYDSRLLKEIYLSIDESSECYAFTDDFEFCGIFLVNSKLAIEHALYLSKTDSGNTFFILEKNQEFHFRINYYAYDHSDHPNSFDIQRSVKTVV